MPFLTFRCVKNLLVQCNVCQVAIGFVSVLFLHVCIGVWIDLGGGAPVIDLPVSWESAPPPETEPAITNNYSITTKLVILLLLVLHIVFKFQPKWDSS